MKLIKLSLHNFRKFDKAEFDLDSDTVLICGPNETGKSTIHQGIIAALFGIGTESAGLLAKDEIKSLQGGNPAVELLFSAQGETYKIERDLEKGKARLFKKTELSDFAKVSEDLKFISQFILKTIGVSSPAVFNKTASIKQADLAQISNLSEIGENLEKIFAGTGNISLQKVEAELDKLRKSLRKERNEKSGELDKLAERKGELEKRLFDAQNIASESQNLSEEVEQLSKLVPELEARISELDSLLLKLQEKINLETKRNDLRKQWKEANEKLSRILAYKERKRKIDEELQEFAANKKTKNQQPILAFSLGILGFVLAGISFASLGTLAVLLIFGVIFLAAAILIYFFPKKKPVETDEQKNLLLEKEILERSKENLEEEANLASILENLEFDGNAQNRALEAFGGFNPSTEEVEKWKSELGARKKELAESQERFHFSRGVLKVEREGNVSPEILAGELEYLENQIQEKEQLYQAILVAQQTILGIKQEYHGQHLPVLEKEVSRLFSVFTNGFHNKVALTENWPAILVEDEKGNLIPEALSQGALDQLYFAFRLATADLLSQNVKIPLLLDDPMVHFDDQRRNQAIAILAEVAKERQVIYFTHDEELAGKLTKSIGKSKLVQLV